MLEGGFALTITDSGTGLSYDFGDRGPVITVDSRESGKTVNSSPERWNELWLFETADGYALVDVGRSVIDGERDIFSVHIADSLPGVIASMVRRDSNGVLFLTRTRKAMVARINERYGTQTVVM